MNEIDCKGLACPQPVVKTKKAIEAGKLPLTIIVDNEVAKENVSRMAKKLGCSLTVESEGEIARIMVTRDGASMAPPKETKQKEDGKLPSGSVVYISSETMGHGDDKLGSILIRGFLKTLMDLSPLPKSIIFLNGGVKLVVEEAEKTVPAIKALAEAGVDVMSCGTCLDFFEMKDRVAVGRVTNMYEIVETLAETTRVVKP